MHFDIVVAGGGAGGLQLAARLGRQFGRRQGAERVLLVDRFSFHIWKPTLHEVAAGTLNVHQEGLPYTVLARRNHFSFMMGELTALDAQARAVSLGEVRDAHGRVAVPARTVGFGQLVLALGSGSNTFSTPGVEHAYLLEDAQDAERFNNDWLAACARAAFSDDQVLRVAIVGAGATGVELAAELLESHELLQQSVGSGLRFRLDITLVEGSPRILGGLPEKVSAKARRTLEGRRVRVMTDTRVTAIEPGRLVVAGGELQVDMVVWAAGIKAASENARLGLEVNRLNQFVVDRYLRTAVEGVYAMGDCAACPQEDGTVVPARAQAAHQQATYLARRLSAPAGSEARHAPFVYRDQGSLVSLGENRGVGNLMGSLAGSNFFVEGLVAKWMYMSLHLNHHRVILGASKTAVLALARLLQQRVSGRLKLH